MSKSDNETDSLSDNVQLDINQLQPAEVNFDNLETSHSKSNSNSKFNFGEFEVSEKENSEDSSFQNFGATKFLKKSKQTDSPRAISDNSLTQTSKSTSKSTSKVSSKNSNSKKSNRNSISSSKEKKSGAKIVPKINPKKATRLTESVTAQIDQKKIDAGIEIENEMKRIQMELLEQRQKR